MPRAKFAAGFRGCRRSLSLPVFFKITSQHLCAFFSEDSGCHLRFPWRSFKYKIRTCISFLSQYFTKIPVRSSIYQSSQFYPYHSAAAHKTRFTAGVHRIVTQICDSCFLTESPDQPCFRMKGRIRGCIDLIFIGIHYFPVLYQNCAKGFVPMLPQCISRHFYL